MTIKLRLFGTPTIECNTRPEVRELADQAKVLALLIYLVVARPRGVHQRDHLANLFWAELDQQHARAALRKTLHRMHRVLGDGTLDIRGNESIGVLSGAVQCDALAFDDALDGGMLTIALDHYQSGLLPAFHVRNAREFDEWLDAERAHYRERAVAAAWALTQRFAATSDLTNASQLARKVAKLAATDERVLRRVLKMLETLGDRAGAVEVYARFRDNLWRDFETRPSTQTEQLMEAIRNNR